MEIKLKPQTVPADQEFPLGSLWEDAEGDLLMVVASGDSALILKTDSSPIFVVLNTGHLWTRKRVTLVRRVQGGTFTEDGAEEWV